MLNRVGSLPPRAVLAALPGARVPLYGKTPAPGRKLGHVTLRARSAPALGRALAAAEARIAVD